MTREEAAKILKLERDSLRENPKVKVDQRLYDAFDVAIKELEAGWVPVSERLPKEGRKIYLTCFQDGYMATIMLGSDGKWLIEGEEPIAWMPLPEPYKAESEE